MLPNLHQYSHDCMPQLLLNCCLYCFFSLGTVVKLEKKKKKNMPITQSCLVGFPWKYQICRIR